nr:TIGR02679 domain-containing protein [Streptomyces sp. CB01635]
MTGFPDGSGAEWRRETWASAGLLRDALSSTVFTVSLRGTPALDWMTDMGEPAVGTPFVSPWLGCGRPSEMAWRLVSGGSPLSPQLHG